MSCGFSWTSPCCEVREPGEASVHTFDYPDFQEKQAKEETQVPIVEAVDSLSSDVKQGPMAENGGANVELPPPAEVRSSEVPSWIADDIANTVELRASGIQASPSFKSNGNSADASPITPSSLKVEDGDARKPSKKGSAKKELGPDDFQMLLLAGRLREAEEVAQRHRASLDSTLVAWLEEEMAAIRAVVGNVANTAEDAGPAASMAKKASKTGGWKDVVIPEINGAVSWRWRSDGIEFRTGMELPARMQDAVAINVEIDLNAQWMPFNPTLKPTFSQTTAALLTHTNVKLPGLPGSREMYTYRLIVDCLDEASLVGDGRRGVLFVDRCPDVWKKGGHYKGEFDIPPPPGGWISRDEQRLSVAFWEPVADDMAKLTIFGEVAFAVPKWLLPDSAVSFLCKTIMKTTYKNLSKAFKELESFGYEARMKDPKNPKAMIYESVAARGIAKPEAALSTLPSQSSVASSISKEPSQRSVASLSAQSAAGAPNPMKVSL